MTFSMIAMTRKSSEKLLVKPAALSRREGCRSRLISSKFLILCLKAIEDVCSEENPFIPSLLVCPWGLDLWRHCYADSLLLEVPGSCAEREQIAWLVFTTSDIFATKEKQRIAVPNPFLLYLVPSQEKALQVRSLCKPQKALGVNTGACILVSLWIKVRGLKTCAPEFVVSTSERLLELVSLQAIDISGISLLIVVLSGGSDAASTSAVEDLVKGHIEKLSLKRFYLV